MNEFLNKSDITGLTNQQVDQKKALGQINVVFRKNSRNLKDILWSNCFNSLTLLILIVTIIIISIKKYAHLFFLLVSLTNMLISIFQEIKAKKTLDQVSLLLKNSSQVIRNGQKITVAVTDLVLEDVLLLETGQQITVDAKVKRGVIEVNESLLTGETKLIVKREGDFLYSGSYVVSGQCLAEIVAVGKDIYIEKITQAAKKYKQPKTPLMKSLFLLIQIIMVFLTLFVVILTIFGRSPHNSILKNDQFWLGLCGMMIAMLPLGLFLLTNINLAVGFINLAKQKAYAQNLFGIEMLAQINTLCLDKTGTITDGTMQVKTIIPYYPKHFPFEKLIASFLKAESISNHTRDALMNKFGQITDLFLPKQNIPFSSVRKYSVVKFDGLGTYFLGAPEFILKNNFSLIQQDFETQVKLGHRVLLFAQVVNNIIPSNDPMTDKSLDDFKRIPLALIVIEDNIKKDAPSTIDFFQKNDVVVKVISGDNYLTVSQIAKRVGINGYHKAISLEGMTDEKVAKIATQYDVFGRTSPQQKKILIQNLKKMGQKVAMTGDGINDILALKEADLSIAMASGSQATRNISNLVLMDSNFASMPQVVFEGRRIINNLDKISVLFFTKTIIAFLLALAVIVFNIFCQPCYFPFDPLKLQFIMDYWVIGIPSLLLSFEKNHQIISGRFWIKNLKKALPYAILSFVSYCFIYIHKVCINQEATVDDLRIIANYSILASTLILFTVLALVCKPFNLAKRVLLIVMLAFCLFFSNILSVFKVFISLNPLEIILLVVIFILSLLISYFWKESQKKIR
ncbi:HAD-IC family P-type ATPase ['Fragaria x ananassa' phyllody phytoplasma]|uniref:HAD-IC family P-type ATPase n=1 Tax='Fragaria x ananassa' phyllody phytoplasma TaxID=2358428 RepID=A0ABS5K4W2_9MOLU|nr:HAD-IC family P-type ATPase ['Fragaria x ananassa' phyllody phytoplasma]MBS2126350.1 HAD-IC family P-type ATPase ['Fragaria x ananassa' phyllody phytoplasma]